MKSHSPVSWKSPSQIDGFHVDPPPMATPTCATLTTGSAAKHFRIALQRISHLLVSGLCLVQGVKCWREEYCTWMQLSIFQITGFDDMFLLPDKSWLEHGSWVKAFYTLHFDPSCFMLRVLLPEFELELGYASTMCKQPRCTRPPSSSQCYWSSLQFCFNYLELNIWLWIAVFALTNCWCPSESLFELHISDPGEKQLNLRQCGKYHWTLSIPSHHHCMSPTHGACLRIPELTVIGLWRHGQQLIWLNQCQLSKIPVCRNDHW